MVKLTKADVKHTAHLAKLKLSESELEKFSKQLSSIVDYIGELNEVDTLKTEPTSQTTGLTDVLREDKIEVENCLTQEESVSGTDNIHNNYFIVSRVLEK
ncbi:MAG TPA: Asp-tRNA(Asn)/Glu-tRNA(Gln) amidotransferase subunit GatC [Patescibacteria group bacterium]